MIRRSISRSRLRSSLVAFVALVILAFSAAAAHAETSAPGWDVTSTTYPSNLAPSGGTGFLEVDVYNSGKSPSSGPVVVTDVLPPGVVATQAADLQSGSGSGLGEEGLWQCSTGHVVVCENTANLPTLPIPQLPGGAHEHGTGQILHIGIAVTVETAEPGVLVNSVTVSGGGALATASSSSSITVSAIAASAFGFQGSDGWLSNPDGTSDTQAGSHPYEFVYSLDLNTHPKPGGTELTTAGGQARNLTVKLPPGFVGNPTAVPQCTRQQLEEEACPPSSQVGTDIAGAKTGEQDPFRVGLGVYNMVPPPGLPAQFGLVLFGVFVYLDPEVRSGSDYGLTVHANNLPEEHIMANRIILWGEPADPSHDGDRVSAVVCPAGCASSAPRVPFLTLPTACGGPQQVTASADTWEPPSVSAETSFTSHDSNGVPTGVTGCDHLGFAPTITASPDTSETDTPAGLTVDVHVPQEGLVTTGALATSDIKNTTVRLPAGFVINPGQAAGLQACQAGQDALTSEAEKAEGKEDNGPVSCPNASKVGTVQIATPLLKENLEGSVYVLQSDPPHVKLLVAVSGEGVNLKLVGDVELCETAGESINGKTCEAPGQLITTFTETPELPFTDFKLSFTGGAQAALDTPTTCGTYTTTSDFTPWSTTAVADVFPSSSFPISSGPNGSACPSAQLPFGPSLIAGATNPKGGAFTGFSLLLQSGDGQQRIEKLQFKAPPGLSGMLSAVPLCPDPQAAQGTCSSASQIGHSTVASGPGPYPLTIPQPGDPESPIYLTGPYNGRGACNVSEAGCAPFGLTIVTHVIAGPFNLGNVITRARIEVDRHTAQITVTTDALPQVIDGVPTDLRLVDAVIDRPGFMFNPTHCAPAAFAGTAYGTPPPGAGGSDATAGISSSFDVVGCKGLAFAPSFKVSTSGKTSKARGASLTAKIIYPSTPPGAQATNYANIARAKVDLPKQLPSRLTTLQKACTNAQFEANPAGCPAASVIGHARVITPLLPVPVEGPAYFVSHGGEAFPSLIMVLQGYGVRVDLIGTTFISKAGITSSTFKTTPDVPLTSFELTLPQGKFSALAANGNLCKSKLAMPTEFVAQNGAKINESTKISVTGCAKSKALTRAQKLTRALKVCKKKAKAKRAKCQAAARQRYRPLKQVKHKGAK
jgi:uncharacterized repeat protein (TIGR01451 family)